jgi:hypothetical protein
MSSRRQKHGKSHSISLGIWTEHTCYLFEISDLLFGVICTDLNRRTGVFILSVIEISVRIETTISVKPNKYRHSDKKLLCRILLMIGLFLACFDWNTVSFMIFKSERLILDRCKLLILNAGDGNRTHTPLAGPRILSPVRLPVSPPRHILNSIV